MSEVGTKRGTSELGQDEEQVESPAKRQAGGDDDATGILSSSARPWALPVPDAPNPALAERALAAPRASLRAPQLVHPMLMTANRRHSGVFG